MDRSLTTLRMPASQRNYVSAVRRPSLDPSSPMMMDMELMTCWATGAGILGAYVELCEALRR